MNKLSLFCGDTFVTNVNYKCERFGVLSKDEHDKIQMLAQETEEYKNFNNWLGFGYLTIKFNI
jgi:hypothetical protein